VRLIPKGLAGLVPIRIDGADSPRLTRCSIDDDPLVHAVWKRRPSRAGRSSESSRVPRRSSRVDGNRERSTIYVDSNSAAQCAARSSRASCRPGIYRRIRALHGARARDLPFRWLDQPPSWERSAGPRSGGGRRIRWAARPVWRTSVAHSGSFPSSSAEYQRMS